MAQRSQIENILHEISCFFPSIPYHAIKPTLSKYSCLDRIPRLKETLRDHLVTEEGETYPPKNLRKDVDYIKAIFPEYDKKYIRKKLLSVGDVGYRIEVVVRKLLVKEMQKKQYAEGSVGKTKKSRNSEVNGEAPSIKKFCPLPDYIDELNQLRDPINNIDYQDGNNLCNNNNNNRIEIKKLQLIASEERVNEWNFVSTSGSLNAGDSNKTVVNVKEMSTHQVPKEIFGNWAAVHGDLNYAVTDQRKENSENVAGFTDDFNKAVKIVKTEHSENGAAVHGDLNYAVSNLTDQRKENVAGFTDNLKKAVMNVETEHSENVAGAFGDLKEAETTQSTILPLPIAKHHRSNEPEPEVVELGSDDEEEGAVALMESLLEQNKDHNIDKRLLYHIMEMFPLADTDFLRNLVRHKEFTDEEISQVIDEILSMPNYPKRNHKSPKRKDDDEIIKEEKLATLRELLPDADPHFLEESLEDIATERDFEKFVSKCLQDRNYPTYQEFVKNNQLLAQVTQYTDNFSIPKFLELHPDPVAFFESNKCKAMDMKCDKQIKYIDSFLRNTFPKLSVRQINQTLYKTKHNLLSAFNELDNCTTGKLNSTRKTVYKLTGLKDIPLLQAFAYLKHKKEIIAYLEKQKASAERERVAVKQLGLMKTCHCCYDDEVMPHEIVSCAAGCEFCKSCLENSVKILFSEGKLEYPCLASCEAQFNIPTLQKSLNPKLFSKLVQKKQLEEIKAAGIEDIEFCPFCDFATIPTPEDRLFVCLNPDCMKESCRLCKEPSHIPLRCDEVEKDDEVKRRTYIENKMTEALLRKCMKCGLTFIKADGCNKMTCSCGAMMCYVCNQPVQDYKHFNGQGGTQYHLCPLYSDTIKLHRDAVLKSVAEAKQALGTNELKVDPTVGIQEYFDKEIKKAPNKVPPGMMHQ